MVAKIDQLYFKTFVTPPKKNPSKASDKRQIEVIFGGTPSDFFHFTHYSIESNADFLNVRLWYDDGEDAVQVFRGLIWKLDLKDAIPTLKQYIEKVGAATSYKQSSGIHRVRWESPPVAFNVLDCASRGDSWGELVIKKFSHKSVVDASKKDVTVSGTTHGVYVSHGNIHRALIIDLITKASKSA